jgi:hypothetical protein
MTNAQCPVSKRSLSACHCPGTRARRISEAAERMGKDAPHRKPPTENAHWRHDFAVRNP